MGGRLVRLCGFLVAALLAAAVAASPAGAVFGPPFNLSAAGQNAFIPQVVVDADGDAVFTWEGSDGTNARAQIRARSAGGALSAVQNLSAAGQDAFSPGVAIDADGDTVFTWVRQDGTTDCGGVGCFRVQARARSAAGDLSAVQNLSAAGQDAFTPRVAVGGDGDAVFAWRHRDGTTDCGGMGCFRVQARARSAGGALSAVRTLSAAGQDASSPEVGVDADGDAVFTWQRSDGTNDRAQIRARSAAGDLSTVRNLSAAGQDAVDPRVAVDADGDAVATWRFDASNERIQARARSAAGALSAVQNLSAAGQDAFNPQVAVGGDGDAVFTWLRDDGTADCGGAGCIRAQARARSAAGDLSAVQTLSAAGQDAGSPQVAVDTGGNAVLTWERQDGTTDCGGVGCFRMQARARSAAGDLSAVQTLSAAGQDASSPQVAADSDDAAVTWERSDGTNVRAQGAATFHPLPPPPPPAPPSNEFSFGKVKKNKKKGTAKLTVLVPGPGALDLARTNKVKGDEESVEAAAARSAGAEIEAKLKIKPRRKAKKKLNEKGKAKVKAEVTYTPTGGEPNTKTKKLKLKKKRR
jgi:hypothetical protein